MNPAQRLILGIEKPYLNNAARKFLNEFQPGGIILFDRNGESLTQLKVLIEDIKSSLNTPPFIAIDFEGGRVRRCSALFSRLERPALYLEDDFESLKADAGQIAAEFNEVGINLNFAPVADLQYEPLNAALSGRTCSIDPSEASEYCGGFIDSFQSSGVYCGLKHFPGLGSAVNDPHRAVSISCISSDRYMANDLIPFKAGIGVGAKFLMTTHMVMTCIDKRIATFSPKVIELTRLIGFESIIITDDMSMGAVKNQAGLEENVLKALNAGHDMALICHDLEKHAGVIEHLEKNIGRLEQNGHAEALKRIANVKEQFA